MENFTCPNGQLKDIAKAQAIGDECFAYVLDFIRPGVSEQFIADKIEEFLLENGAEALAFPSIVVSGARGWLMHGEPTEKLLEIGELITLDFGGVVNGCCGDMTRTVALGEPNARQKEIYRLVLASQLAGLEAIRAGVSTRYVDSICRGVTENAGYGEYFIHGTGHAVGRLVHEEPRVNKSTDSVLQKGLAITIEPGIYIENELGVRIEDLVIVDEYGIINLTKSPKELIVL